MAYVTTEVLVKKAVHSKILNRVIRPGEIVEVPNIECLTWLTSGYAELPPPPEIDEDHCAFMVDDEFNQCQRKPGHGPESLYCKQHAKKVMADADASG